MRRGWYLGAVAVGLLAIVGFGTLVESSAPAAHLSPPVASPVLTVPTATPSTAAAAAPASTPAPTTAPPPAGYAFPVVAAAATYARTHHDYPAADIIAPCGSPVVAVTDGTILEVSRSDTYNAATDDGATRGGLFVSLLGDDGVRYYGSHFRSIEAGINGGVRVHRGDRLGRVGDSGDASVCHLHFGISPPCARVGDWWVRRGEIWPAPYLDAWRQGRPSAPVAEVAGWSKQHGCPGAP